jgi:hypothetical protein
MTMKKEGTIRTRLTYHDLGIQRRVLHYSDGDEIDDICTRCLSIVLDGVTCPHCRETDRKTAARILKLKGRQ